MFSKQIIIGARGSPLSIKQVQEVAEALKKITPALKITIKTITTRGDRIKKFLLQEKGLFVKEIEEALLRGEIDLAVHSLKDLPVRLAKGLTLAAVTKRIPPYDVFVSRVKRRLRELPQGAVIGTSSLRRKAQLLLLREDLKIVELRGNIDTRMRKLKEYKLDGIICAWCALQRLGLKELDVEKLSLKQFLPAPGQGALGIEVRKEDKIIMNLVKKINHLSTFLCVGAERDFLKFLGGGCKLPLGAWADIKGNFITLRGLVAKPDGSRAIRLKQTFSVKYAHKIGEVLAREAIKKGALEILHQLQ